MPSNTTKETIPMAKKERIIHAIEKISTDTPLSPRYCKASARLK